MEFKELNKKLSVTIKRIAFKLNGRYRTFSHDDLYQEAVMHLWSNFNSGKLTGKTDSYILQGCYFHLKNYIRKVNEKPQVSLDELICADIDGAGFKDMIIDKSHENMRGSLDTKLLAQRIMGSGLTLREKTILNLLSKGLTTRKIGKRLSLSHVMVVRVIGGIRKKCSRYIE